LFIVDGAKALSRAVRDTFGRFALIQRCQVHKGRNIVERLDPSLHAGVKKVLRQAWDSPTAEQAERVLRNLARRLDHDAPGVSASIHEGLDEMLTVIRLGLPDPLRRALGCTNAIESLMAVLRQVCRNVKRWRNARMALRWTGTAMLEAQTTFRNLKAYKHLPVLRAALLRHQQAVLADQAIDRQSRAA
jgi:transposase-like protein